MIGTSGRGGPALSPAQIRRRRGACLVLSAVTVLACVVATAVLIPVMIDQEHPVHVTGTITSGHCYTAGWRQRLKHAM